MPSYYPEELTRRSRAILEKLRAWRETTSAKVTVIGGWAVHELVEEGRGQLSRDLDIVVHDGATLTAFDQIIPSWGLEWKPLRFTGEGIGCRDKGDTSATILVDVFTTEFFDPRPVGIPWPPIRKPLGTADFIPTTEFLLLDKIQTVAARQGHEADDKQAKDLLDIHRLVFHNRAGLTPRQLLLAAKPGARRQAASRIARAKQTRPQFAPDFDVVQRWLEAA